MKILTVFTGGTIGSWQNADGTRKLKNVQNSLEDKGVSSKLNAQDYQLIRTFVENNSDYDIEEFIAIAPLNTFSENMSLAKLTKLMAVINAENLKDYDGIIITHGTDTLAYSAAIISQLTANYDIPVVLVSSNHPLDNAKANGHINFASAVKLISAKVWRGTFVTYSYDLDTTQVYLASRIEQSQVFSDRYSSIGGRDFATIGSDGIIIEDTDASEALFLTNPRKRKITVKATKIEGNVLIISPYVGINYDNYNLDNVDGVIHTLYHSFTYPNEGGSASMLSLAERCKSKGIKFLLAPIDYLDQSYEGSIALDIAAKCPRQSLATVYAKMLIAISQGMNDIEYREYMAGNVAQEIFDK